MLRLGIGYGLEHPDRGLVATTTAWALSPAADWIAMVLVQPEFRGQGLARRLMERCVADLKAAGRGAWLDATVMGAPLYRKLGFDGADEIVRVECPDLRRSPQGRSSTCEPLSGANLRDASAMDAWTSGLARPAVLRDFLERWPEAGWLSRDEAGDVRGFVLGRDGRFARQCGPLVAASGDEAAMLLQCALAGVGGKVILDVPVAQSDWLAHLAGLGFVEQRRFLRMSLPGSEFTAAPERCFAVAGPDFG